MATLTRTFRWEPFAPDLGDNREQSSPFVLLIASGLTKEELRAFHVSLESLGSRMGGMADDTARVDAWTEAFAPYVRMGEEPLIANGKPVATLRDYFELLLLDVAGQYNTIELARSLADYNSLTGTHRLFFERLSGGLPSTPAPSNGRSANRTAAPPNGRQTNASSGDAKPPASSVGMPPPKKEENPSPGTPAG